VLVVEELRSAGTAGPGCYLSIAFRSTATARPDLPLAAGTIKHHNRVDLAPNTLYAPSCVAPSGAVWVRLQVSWGRTGVPVAESVTPVRGGMTWGDTKGHERREVPLPRFLIDDLSRQVAGCSPDDLVFTGLRGAVMRSGTFRRGALISAARSLDIPGFHPHELRHTAASLAIASGADIKVVQQMMDHKSATMTLDQYGHLFPDRLDVVAGAMDAARSSALADVPSVRALRGGALS
jgi:hypothetical protein